MKKYNVDIANIVTINPLRIISRILTACLILVLPGCADFLDEVPDNRVSLNNL